MSVEEIVQQFPPLNPADVHDALAYAYEHIAEIEADLSADDETSVKASLGKAHAIYGRIFWDAGRIERRTARL